ncbi:hypothetical protein D9611_006424 [Ephemerocybe angulata]|uniref:Uncharacterized protein n=1 Tax=Ephemerocybe angulata TaxID=980116 RepID=A0A8H5C6L1_9AGAR|nr:hypothetical protein D9611_006424 [Tulosesus angulatus]
MNSSSMPSQPSWVLNWPLEPIPLSEKPVYGHPELERPDYVTLKAILHEHPVRVDTSVDVLDVGAGEQALAVQKKGLNHEQLVAHLEANGSSPPALRILFLNEATLDPKSPKLSGSLDNTQVALHPSTIFYFIKHLGVCPIFLSNITTTPWLLNTGNATFTTYQSDGLTPASVQGFFRYSVRGRPAHVWFRHNMEEGTSTYIVQYCPERPKASILQWATAPTREYRQHVLRPFALECLIVDEVSMNWSEAVVHTARGLLKYEHLKPEEYDDNILKTAVHELHTMSQHFYIMEEELNGITEQLDYLVDVHEFLLSSRKSKWVKTRYSKTTTSTSDSLAYLRSRTKNWHRWVVNLRERTNVRINLFFNLATTKIATETQKDNSSMITIAALSLLFLPGTFVAALFSMPFFQTDTSKMSMAYGWWLYPAITIPFTAVIFVVWIMWMGRRKRATQGTRLLQDVQESSVPLVSVGEAWRAVKTWWRDRASHTPSLTVVSDVEKLAGTPMSSGGGKDYLSGIIGNAFPPRPVPAPLPSATVTLFPHNAASELTAPSPAVPQQTPASTSGGSRLEPEPSSTAAKTDQGLSVPEANFEQPRHDSYTKETFTGYGAWAPDHNGPPTGLVDENGAPAASQMNMFSALTPFARGEPLTVTSSMVHGWDDVNHARSDVNPGGEGNVKKTERKRSGNTTTLGPSRYNPGAMSMPEPMVIDYTGPRPSPFPGPPRERQNLSMYTPGLFPPNGYQQEGRQSWPQQRSPYYPAGPPPPDEDGWGYGSGISRPQSKAGSISAGQGVKPSSGSKQVRMAHRDGDSDDESSSGDTEGELTG